MPVPVETAGQRQLLEPLLLPLVNQFTLMQQQMMDQFQQAILGMAQMFTALQRDQMVLIREELQHLREVTQELHELQARALQEPAPAAQSNGSPAAAKAEAPPPRPTNKPATEPRPAVPRPARKRDREKATRCAATPAPPPPRAKEPAASAPGEGAPVPAATAPGPSQEAAPEAPAASTGRSGNSDIHGWLAKRIESLQHERQSRWQKIMGFLTGKRS
jgi:hypothetical protein